jgi:hypothetical protein
VKTTRRSGISQSLDLFIIIGAVLAVGGVVASTATGLIGSAAATPSLQLVQFSLVGSSRSPDSLILTLKNVGTSTVAIGNGFSVTMSTDQTTPSPTVDCTAPGNTPVSYAGSAAVAFQMSALDHIGSNICGATGTVTGLRWIGPNASVSLAPGQQLTFSVSPAVSSTGLITSGNTYSITVVSTGQSIVQNVIAQ